MAAYTFKPSASTVTVNWSNPAVWAGGVVPNSADADVDFPIVTQVSSGYVYTSDVYIQSGESFTANSLALRDYLIIDGSLTVNGALTQYADGEIDMGGGTLTAGSIRNDAYDIQGDGHIVVGTLTNDTAIIGSNLVIDATTLVNNGRISAGGGTTTINVGAGGFSSLAGGTLTGGALEADTQGNLQIHASGPIVTDAASITLSGGTISSFDPATGQYVPLTSSLKTVTSSGTLSINDGSHFGELTVAGTLMVGSTALNVDHLTIAAGGRLQGAGAIASPFENDGTISAGYEQDYRGNSGLLTINGAVTGNGSFEILAGHHGQNRFDPSFGPTLELNAPTSQNVVFDDNLGILTLDQPGSFTGRILTAGSGDTIILPGVALSSITGTSYATEGIGGALTLQEGGSAIVLHFAGVHSLSEFTLTAGYQALSSDPPSLRISVAEHQTAAAQDFNGDGEADLMWLNRSGAFQTWSSDTPHGASQDLLVKNTYSNGYFQNWSITDSFDFDGDGHADILWRNTNGAISVWTGNASGFQLGAYDGSAPTSWKIAGAGDFNADGRDDILLRNDDGSISTWLSTGTSFQQNAYSHASVGASWQVEGVGDFNGDGKADIFWRSAYDGSVSIWNSTGSGFQESSYFQGQVGLDWHAEGIGDFNGDGSSDIVWRNDNGQVTVWLGTSYGFSENWFMDNVPAGWNIANVGDYNGDGKDDLLWRHADGATSVWNSTGNGWQQGATFDTSVGNDWTLAGHVFPI